MSALAPDFASPAAAPLASSSPATRPGALGHLRVLDLSRVLAGPWSGQLLADYLSLIHI